MRLLHIILDWARKHNSRKIKEEGESLFTKKQLKKSNPSKAFETHSQPNLHNEPPKINMKTPDNFYALHEALSGKSEHERNKKVIKIGFQEEWRK